MGFLLFRTALAAIPAIGILYLLSRSAANSSDSFRGLIPVFSMGILTLIPAAILELLLSQFIFPLLQYEYPPLLDRLIRAFILAAAVEETVKYIAVKKYIFTRIELPQTASAVLYTAAAGLGFAFFENLLYSLDSTSVLVIRALTAVPLHALTSALTGYYLGLSRSGRTRPGRGLIPAILLHGVYDFLIFSGGAASLLVIPLLILSAAVIIRLVSASFSGTPPALPRR